MGYYIDQLAEQDRQKRLTDLLMAGETGNFPAFMPEPDYRDARDLGAISTGGGLPQNGMMDQQDADHAKRYSDYIMSIGGVDANGRPTSRYVSPQDFRAQGSPSPQFRGESMVGMYPSPQSPPRQFLSALAKPQFAVDPSDGLQRMTDRPGEVMQADVGTIRNNRTGVVTRVGGSGQPQPTGLAADWARPVDVMGAQGHWAKDGSGRIVMRDGRIVDLGRDTGRERAIEKENIALQKQRAELAQLQAKPSSEYDKVMAQERAKRDIFASMPPAMREAEEVKRLGIKLKPGEKYNMDKGEIELIPGSAPYNKQAAEVREESTGLKGLDRVIGNMLDRVSAVEKSPGLSSAVGFWDAATPAIMSGWNAQDKATSRAYIANLQEYLQTKGLADLRASGVAPGSITEKEWSKFATMVGNIDPTMDEKSFQKELNNLKTYAANARAEAAAKEATLKKQYGPMWEKYAVSGGEAAPAAPEQGGVVRVKSVNDAMKLKSGTRFIDPNGVERVRP